MRKIHGLRAMAAFGLASMVIFVSARADDPSEAEKAQLKRRADQFKESLDWYRVYSGRDSKEPMKPEIILRWSNPVRLQKGETALILWSDSGRPEALASVYPWNGRLVYECVSMARDKGLRATDGEQTFWSPDEPGITFHDLPDAPAPAKTATARLVQMRGIAEPYKITVTTRKAGVEDREEMRFLPKPIYRYDPAVTKVAHPEIVDGAMFAFVQGTDPEAVLMIEAVKKGDKTTWQYAFGRATGWAVEAKLGSSIIWGVPDFPGTYDPKRTATARGRKLVE